MTPEYLNDMRPKMILDEAGLIALVAEFLVIARENLLNDGKLVPAAVLLSGDLRTIKTIRLRMRDDEAMARSEAAVRSAVRKLDPAAAVVISEGTMVVKKASGTRSRNKTTQEVPCVAVFAASPKAHYAAFLEVLMEDGKPVGFGALQERLATCFFTEGLWAKTLKPDIKRRQ